MLITKKIMYSQSCEVVELNTINHETIVLRKKIETTFSKERITYNSERELNTIKDEKPALQRFKTLNID